MSLYPQLATMKYSAAIFAVLLMCLVSTISSVNGEKKKEVKFGDKIPIKEKDMMRKSIVFDKKTPDVFYCPMQKPSSMNKLIVR